MQLLAQVLPQLPNLTELNLQGETSHPSTHSSPLCVCVSVKKIEKEEEKKDKEKGERGKGKGGKREETQNEGNGNVEYSCVT